MEFFQDLNLAWILAFLTKFAIFLTFFVLIQVFQPNRKSPLGFDNKLMGNVFWPWISFFYFYYHKF